MTDTFRLSVLKALVDGVVALVPEIDGRLFRGRSTYGVNDLLPMGSILEDPREQQVASDDAASKGHTVPWRLLVQGFVDDDAANPTDPAYLLAGEFLQALAAVRDGARNSGGVLDPDRKTNVVEKIIIGAPIVRPADEFSEKAYFWIPLTLSLYEDPANPFT